ncbi:hypothetical protein OG462_03300 [Streptomyces sp. NBC_01077]|uniref:hypothetical protein n=1 Tax=Streptomyces sp. NBC_01077 TaxID=2903746 RepID=UPI003865869B|nr:hypothetical protein OG462_03300 [Streptomyces sp. NBC_01077]
MFSGTVGSSANLYYEAGHDASAWAPKARGTVPTGVAVALGTDVAIRRFAERDHHITHWSELERGGTFLALEQPEKFLTDVPRFLRRTRGLTPADGTRECLGSPRR